MLKQNTLSCSLPWEDGGGGGGKNEHRGGLADALTSCLLPGHPPFPRLWHIHTPLSCGLGKLSTTLSQNWPSVWSSPRTCSPFSFSALLKGYLQHLNLPVFPVQPLRCDLILAMQRTWHQNAGSCYQSPWEGIPWLWGSSFSRREQVVNLLAETDSANAVDRANPGVKSIKFTTPAFSLMLVYTGHGKNNSSYFIIVTMCQHFTQILILAKTLK